jgi:hypothetical protein
MIKLTLEEQKYCSKLKRTVEKYYKSPYVREVSPGKFSVESLNVDLEPIDILLEQYFLPTNSPIRAWELAASSCKTTQNINRTHPIKVELSDAEGKYERVKTRRLKNIKK